MHFEKYLVKGDKVVVESNEITVSGEVRATSVLDFRRQYLVRFADGTERWIDQLFVQTFCTKN